MINNHSHVVEVEKIVFNIPTTAVHIPTTAAILAAITTDPNIAEMGPYVAGNADVKTVKVQKICPVPHTLGGLFLHHKEVMWQMYFKIIYPVITTEGKEAVYAMLTTLFHALSVGDPAASSVSTARPAPPPRSATLARRYDKLIKRYFPALCTNGSAAQQTDISIRLVELAAAQNARFEAQQAEKEEKASKSVTKWLGVNRVNSLLNMTGCKNEEELNAIVPIYTTMANAEKTERASASSRPPSTLSWTCATLRASVS